MNRLQEQTGPGGEWLRQFWRKNFLGVFPHVFVTPRRGYKIRCHRRYEIGMCEKIFSGTFYPFDQLPHPVRTVMDLGANIGVFSMYCADHYGDQIRKIVAVEPFEKNYRRFRATVRRNHLESIIAPVNQAVSNAPGRGGLRLGDAHYSHSLHEAKVKTPKAMQSVEITTLDELKKRFQMDALDLLKIDVEGSELQVIAGGHAMLAVTQMLIIEAHKPFSTLGALKKSLAPFGLLPHANGDKTDDDDGDCCFVRK